MREGKFSAVVCWKFDRLGRNTQHLLQVLEEMKDLNVRLIATSQNVDTSTPIGKFFFTILSGFAEMERELIKERIILGIKRAIIQGKHIGRPKGAKDLKERRTTGYFLRYHKNEEITN